MGRHKNPSEEETIRAECIRKMREGLAGEASKDEVASAVAIYKTLKGEEIDRGSAAPVLRVSDRCADAFAELRRMMQKGLHQSALAPLEATVEEGGR